jgi:hypothetical protein
MLLGVPLEPLIQFSQEQSSGSVSEPSEMARLEPAARIVVSLWKGRPRICIEMTGIADVLTG